MSSIGPATAIDNDPANAVPVTAKAPQHNFRDWLRIWTQVLIAELLHVLDRRRSSSVR